MPTREEIIVQNITPFLQPRQHILEIGAGNGLVAELLHRATRAEFTLLDVVDYNRSKFPIHIYDGKALPFPDKMFDRALVIFVLHHNPDPRPIMREALRVSRQGVLVVENDVRGAVKKPATRIIDSLEFVRRGVPRCYMTKSVEEWVHFFEALPARAEMLHTFKIGWFWHNAILDVSRIQNGHL
jgi:ubiquinone/menaquinone biosynthesis C-methylase UbiE